MNKLISIFAVTASILVNSPVFATDVAIKDQKFSDVSALLEQMTPEQRSEVLRQAQEKEKGLRKLSPEEREKLANQLRVVADTIKMEQIDTAKLDPAKSKSTNQTISDLNTYQSKYSKGQIKNSAVK